MAVCVEEREKRSNENVQTGSEELKTFTRKMRGIRRLQTTIQTCFLRSRG